MLVGTDNNDSSNNAIITIHTRLSLHRQRIRTLCCPPSPSSRPHPLLTELPHRASNGFSFSLVCPTTGRSLIQCHNCRALFASRKRVASAIPDIGVRCLGCGALTITDESLAAACSGTTTTTAAAAVAAAATSSPQRVSAMQTVAIQTCLADAAEYTRVKVSQRAELLDILKLKNKAFWKAKFAEEEEEAVAPARPPPPPPLPLPILISDPQISPTTRDKGKARVLAKRGSKKDASSAKQPAAAKKTVATRKEVAEQSKKPKTNKRKSDDASAAGKTSTKRVSRPTETEAPDGMAEMSLAPVLLAEAAAASAAAAAATSTDTLSAEAAAAASTAQSAVQTSAPSAQSDAQTGAVAAGDGNASSSTAKAANPPPKNHPCVAKKATAHADKLSAAKTPAVQAPAASGAPPPAGQGIMDVDNPSAGASKKNRRKRRSTKHKDAQAAGGGGGDEEEEEPAVAITTLRTNKGKRSHPAVLDPQAEPSAKRRKKGEKPSSHGAGEAVTDGDSPVAAAAAASNNDNVEPVKPEISMQELEVRLAVCETLLAQLADPRALHAAIVDVTPTCDVAFTSWDRELLTLTYPPPISHTVQTILHLALIIVARPPTTTTSTRHPLHETRDVLLAATATANNPLPSTPRAARLMAAFTCDAGVAFQIAAAPVLRAMEAVGREIEDAVMCIARWSGLATRGKSGCSDGDGAGDSAAGAAATGVEEGAVGDELALALALDEKPPRCVEDEARQQRLVTRLGLLRKLYRHLTQMAVPGAGGPG
ncbi:hypothetical protein HDU88_006104 [Geranomyces variabilis]|nr:hypothetical protein HDU88_006104 [Geranomyces variabilis]